MAPPGRVRSRRRAGAVYSKNTLRRTHPMKEKAGQKHKPTDVFEFPDNSEISSNGSENKKDDDPYETFDPPLHSTAIYAEEEELSQHCGSSVPSTPPGKATKESLSTSANEASESASVKLRATKEEDVSPLAMALKAREKARYKEKFSHQRESETQKKETMSRGKRQKTRNEAGDSDISDSVHIWCLEGKKNSDIMELDIVLSALEKAVQEHKERIESKICKEAINKFHCNIKEELIKMLKEAQMLKHLKRKNAKVIAAIKKRRQRLIEVQDELLRLEPQLKQLETKYDELKERKSSLRTAADFLSNLKQLYHEYSDLQEKEPDTKETYEPSSLPALLFKARTLLGAEKHLQNINHQLENLLDQD